MGPAFPKPTPRMRVPRPLKKGEHLGARRARVKAAGTLTPEQWQAICRVYAGRCGYCLKRGLKMQMDHIQPIAKGGEHVSSNVIPACAEGPGGGCNYRKGTQIWEPNPAIAHPYRKGASR